MTDLISREEAIEYLMTNMIWYDEFGYEEDDADLKRAAIAGLIDGIPSAQTEPLTDKEQRIFLAAMEREEKVCEEVDRNFVREPYEDSLMRVCKEIRRKVKCALWT